MHACTTRPQHPQVRVNGAAAYKDRTFPGCIITFDVPLQAVTRKDSL